MGRAAFWLPFRQADFITTVLSFVVAPGSLLLLLHLFPGLVLSFAYYALLELFKALLAVLGVRWEGELQSFIVLPEYFVNGLVLAA